MNRYLIDLLAETIIRVSKSLGVPDTAILEGIRRAYTESNLVAVARLHNTTGMIAKGAKHKSAERVRVMDSLVFYFNGLSVLMLKELDDCNAEEAVKCYGYINWIAGALESYWLAENATRRKSVVDGSRNAYSDEYLRVICDMYSRALRAENGNKFKARKLTGASAMVMKLRKGKALSGRAIFNALAVAEKRGIKP